MGHSNSFKSILCEYIVCNANYFQKTSKEIKKIMANCDSFKKF